MTMNLCGIMLGREAHCAISLSSFFRGLTLAILAPAILWAAESKYPNIVIIMADDLGYGDVQCLNPERGKIPTPHLDRFASQGLTLTDAHSGSSVCTPTRYGLLTGRYAWRTRLQSGVLDGGNNEPLIAEGRLTLPGLLKKHAYTTACIGKWHLGFQSDSQPGADPNRRGIGSSGLPVGATIRGGPSTRGFDYFWGCSNARAMSSLIENDRVIEFLAPVEMLPRLTAQAVEFLEREARKETKQPFFLYVPLTSPHSPIVPSRQWQGKSELGAYGDFVMQTDNSVGQILAALDQHGLQDSTFVIVTSDNGCAVSAGVEMMEQKGHYTSAHFRGYKTHIWEGGHRMPFFARWPGVIPAGKQSDTLFCFTDVISTIGEMLGETLPDDAGEDSVSQWQMFLGELSSPRRESVVHHSANGFFAVRKGEWKLCLCAGAGGGQELSEEEAIEKGLPAWQLYNLEVDPGETNNLHHSHAEVVSELAAQLKADVDRGRSTPGNAQSNDVNVQIPAL